MCVNTKFLSRCRRVMVALAVRILDILTPGTGDPLRAVTFGGHVGSRCDLPSEPVPFGIYVVADESVCCLHDGTRWVTLSDTGAVRRTRESVNNVGTVLLEMCRSMVQDASARSSEEISRCVRESVETMRTSLSRIETHDEDVHTTLGSLDRRCLRLESDLGVLQDRCNGPAPGNGV